MKTKIILLAAVLVPLASALVACASSSTGAEEPPVNSSANLPPLPSMLTPPTSGDVLAKLPWVDVPSMCQQPAGKLTNGKLGGEKTDDPFAALLSISPYGPGKASVATGDLNGDAKADVMAGFVCSQGGVDWPNWVVAYDDQMTIIGSVDLGKITPASHANLASIQIADQQAKLKWATYEGANACLRQWTAKVRISDATAKVEEVEQVGPAGEGC
jgi:hypothetical protein